GRPSTSAAARSGGNTPKSPCLQPGGGGLLLATKGWVGENAGGRKGGAGGEFRHAVPPNKAPALGGKMPAPAIKCRRRLLYSPVRRERRCDAAGRGAQGTQGLQELAVAGPLWDPGHERGVDRAEGNQKLAGLVRHRYQGHRMPG